MESSPFLFKSCHYEMVQYYYLQSSNTLFLNEMGKNARGMEIPSNWMVKIYECGRMSSLILYENGRETMFRNSNKLWWHTITTWDPSEETSSARATIMPKYRGCLRNQPLVAILLGWHKRQQQHAAALKLIDRGRDAHYFDMMYHISRYLSGEHHLIFKVMTIDVNLL